MMLSLLLLICSVAEETGLDPDQAEVERVQTELSAVEENVARLEVKLKAMSGDRARVSDEIEKLELQRAVVSGKIDQHELELAEAIHQLEANQARQAALRAQAEAQQKVLGARLRNLYKRGSLGYAQLFLKQSQRADLLNAYHYAKALTDRDRRALNQFERTIADLETVARALDEFREQAETARAELGKRERELTELLKRRNLRLREIRKKASRNRQLLDELALQREELQMLVRRLTEENADPMALMVPIARYKGRLAWPAPGKLRRKFGMYRDPEFLTKRKHNGIALATPKGQLVRAVYAGRVLYADWFKSYGNLVIIDHNEKVFSFYAHCDRLLVRKGDYIARGQEIAYSGDSGSLEGPLLHFEIRNKTAPEDPLAWLEKRRR